MRTGLVTGDSGKSMTTSYRKIKSKEEKFPEEKSSVVAYILWFFLGEIGAHRFYLGQVRTGSLMCALFGVGMVTLPRGVWALVILGIWVLIDAFLIPGMIRSHSEELRQKRKQGF